MKFRPSSLAYALLFRAVHAAPAPSPHEVSISIQIDEAQGLSSPSHHTSITSNAGYCLSVCWQEEQICPVGWNPVQQGPCWTCCLNTSVKLDPARLITVPLNTVETPTKQEIQPPVSSIHSFDNCLAVCMIDELTCPGGWSSVNKSPVPDYPCWTCCMNNGYVAVDAEETPAITEHKIGTKQIDVKEHNNALEELCLKVIFPKEPQCPDGWYSKNLGSVDYAFWTCCRELESTTASPRIEATKKHVQGLEYHFGTQDICFPICWPAQPPTCPVDWSSRNLGLDDEPCWTCCKNPEEESLSRISKTHQDLSTVSVHDHEMASQAICLKACFGNPAEDPAPPCWDGWYADAQGGCWVCCKIGTLFELPQKSINTNAHVSHEVELK